MSEHDSPALDATLDQDVRGLAGTLADQPASTLAMQGDSATTGSRRTTMQTSALPQVELEDNRPSLKWDDRLRYHKLRPLGVGGMGEVLLVNDEDINRKVAMKRLKHDNEPSLVRFIEEIRTIGQLEHPNIVPIHDVGVDDDGAYFFIMKHVEGETLEAVINKLAAGDPAYLAQYTIDVRLRIFVDVLHAIEFAHSRNIIHRDIKPANIMVAPHGEVLVMDWGLAKSVDATTSNTDAKPIDFAETLPLASAPPADMPRERFRLTQHGELLGTPMYMSPEQARGANDRVDRRTDTYALAVLLHEMVTLRHYLEDRTDLLSLLHAIANEKPPPARALPGQAPIPAEVGHFLTRAFQKDPSSRYQDATEMLVDVQRILDGTFAVQCPATLMKRANREASRMIDRSPGMAIITTMLVGAALLGLVAAVIYLLPR